MRTNEWSVKKSTVIKKAGFLVLVGLEKMNYGNKLLTELFFKLMNKKCRPDCVRQLVCRIRIALSAI